MEEGMARARVLLVQGADAGQRDEDRIAPYDVARRLTCPGPREGEEDGIPGRERPAGGKRDNRLATPASLDIRDPLFIGGVGLHSGAHQGDGLTIDAMAVACIEAG